MTPVVKPGPARIRALEAKAAELIDAGASPLIPLRHLRAAAVDPDSRMRLFRFLQTMVRDRPVNMVACAYLLPAARAVRRLEAAERLVEIRRTQAGASLQWDSENFLSHFANSEAFGEIMTRVKYGVESFPAGQTLLEFADQIAPRIRIKPMALDRLFEARSDQAISRDVWESRVRRAFALDHIVQDSNFLAIDLDRHILPHFDQTAWDRIVADVSATGPVVFQTFHSGLLSINRRMYERESNWLTLQARAPSNSTSIAASDDPRTALFAAYREVQNGRSLLLAPDGPWGNRNETLDVLGTQSLAGEGAAFLAYELRTPMFWINILREGDMLVPVVAEGPRRGTGESYANFKLRWNRFYTGEIERLFVGNPDSLALRPRWTRVLAAEPDAE